MSLVGLFNTDAQEVALLGVFQVILTASAGASAFLYLYLPEVHCCSPTEPRSCRSRSCTPDPWVSRPGCWADQPTRNLRSLLCGREPWTLETVKRKRNNSYDRVAKTPHRSSRTLQHWTNMEVTETLQDLLLTFCSGWKKKDNCLSAWSTNKIPPFRHLILLLFTPWFFLVFFPQLDEPSLLHPSSFPETWGLCAGALHGTAPPTDPHADQHFLSGIYVISTDVFHVYLLPHTWYQLAYRPTAWPLIWSWSHLLNSSCSLVLEAVPVDIVTQLDLPSPLAQEELNKEQRKSY